jgi:AcrR family transcriptional regulator
MRKINILAGCDDARGEPRKKAKTRIFETARDLFYRRGIRATGVDEIVCEAGVTKPSLYRSFDSKDDLVAKCLESYASEGLAALEARIEAAGPEPLAQLRALIGYYAEEMAQPGFRGCAMSNAAVEFPEEGHPGRLVVESCKAALRERVVGLTRALHCDDPDTLADGLILLIEGAYSAHHVFGSQGPAIAFVLTTERLIAGHLKDR